MSYELSSKIRVVHVLYSFATGGMEKGIVTTIRNGSGRFEHVIVCLKSSGEMAQHLPEGIQVIAMGKKAGNSIAFLFRLSGVLKRLRPAVIHTRNWVGIDGAFAARLAGIRSIVHGEHGWGINDPFGLSPKRLYVRRAADHVVSSYTCVSKQMEEWLVGHIRVRKPVTQIYNGIDTEKFHPAENGGKDSLRRTLNLPEAVPLVGVVARLDPIKNHGSLFDAFHALQPRFPGMQLLVVGDGPERDRLEGRAGEGIRFLGQRDDTEAVYRALDLFVLPSNNEGISNTILEAMASGLPVVAGRIGGNPELIEDGVNGSLFSPGDAESLAGKMALYLQNSTIAVDHGMEARKTAVSRFPIDKMVSAYEGVWTDTWSSCRLKRAKAP
jgi:sugar transferase (PEP-CTERM/EpsH1 system associated)